MQGVESPYTTTAPPPATPQVEITQPPVASPVTPSTKARMPKVKVPDTWNGEQSKLDTFQAQCNIYVTVYKHRFRDSEAKIL